MADLFDMNIGGLGWHIPTALVALAALFIACFAITGYISFRDGTIPSSAMEDTGNDGDIDFAQNVHMAQNLRLDGLLQYFPSRTAPTVIADGATVTTSPTSWGTAPIQVFNNQFDFTNAQSSTFNIPQPSAADIGRQMIIYFTVVPTGSGTAVFNVGNANGVVTADTVTTFVVGSSVLAANSAFSAANNNRLTLAGAATNTDLGAGSKVVITVASATTVLLEATLIPLGTGATTVGGANGFATA